jgi:branched-subunit amino acid aminotransferase/4-amino-4-deoxychorismate lyase
MNLHKLSAFVRDRFVALSDAVVPIWDLGFTQGVSITEQLRTVGRKLWLLDEHLKRLATGLQLSYLQWPLPMETVRNLAEEVAERNWRSLSPGDDLGLCIVVTGGDQPNFSPNSSDSGQRSSKLVIHAFPLDHQKWWRAYDEGIRLTTVSIREIDTNSVPSELKTRSRMHYWIAQHEAELRRPGTQALLLDLTGNIAETPTASIIAVNHREKAWIAPPKHSILNGVTLDWMERMSPQIELMPLRRAISLDELQQADEVLWLSTPTFVLPVVDVDGQMIGSGQPGITAVSLLELVKRETGIDIAQQASNFAVH